MLNALMAEDEEGRRPEMLTASREKGVIPTVAAFQAEGGTSREDRQSEPSSLEILPVQSTARCDICPCAQNERSGRWSRRRLKS
jgi:hypothetical protein